VAATMALDYPQRVERLVLIGAVTNDEPKKKMLLRLSRLPVIGDIVTPLFLGSRWVLRRRTEQMYRRLGRPIDEHKLEARHHLLATANVHRAMVRTARRWSASRIQRDAKFISQPTMLIWGEDDTHIPIEEAFRLRDEIPNNRLVVFRNCGHLPPTESPEQFVAAVSEFCKAESEPPAVAGG